jgi:hypothetical protein
MAGVKQAPVCGSVSRERLHISQALHTLRGWLARAGRTLLQTGGARAKRRRVMWQVVWASRPERGSSCLALLTIGRVA